MPPSDPCGLIVFYSRCNIVTFSTPFIVLASTFTGKVLCFFNLRRRHLLHDKISDFNCILISI